MGLKPRPKKVNKATVEQELAVDFRAGDQAGVVFSEKLTEMFPVIPRRCLWKGDHVEYEDVCLRTWERLFPGFKLPPMKKKTRVRITIEEIPDGQ
jgi:hypothetical protein